MGKDRVVLGELKEIAEELGHSEAKGDHLIHLAITGNQADPVIPPHVVLVRIEMGEAGAVIKQDDMRSTRNQPAAVVAGNALGAKLVQRLADVSLRRLLFKLHRGRLWVIRSDQEVPIPPPLHHGGGFGSQHCINATELPADLPPDLK